MANMERKILQTTQIDASINMYKNSSMQLENIYPFAMEEELISSIELFDADKAKMLLSKLLFKIRDYEMSDMEAIRFRTMEVCALMSRAAVRRGTVTDLQLRLNNNLIRNLGRAESFRDVYHLLMDNLEIYTDSFAFCTKHQGRLVRKVAAYVGTHFSEKCTLSEVSDSLRCNPSYISSAFRKNAGMSFREFVNHVRIEEAKRLLNNTEYSMLEISLSCGYQDQSYFTKVFRKQTGVTPSQYRSYKYREPSV